MRRFCPGSLMVYVTVAWLQSLRGWRCQLCTCYICKKVDIKQYKWLNFILKEKLHIYRLWIYSDLRHPAANSNGETCFLIEADCMTFWSLFHFKWLLYICVTGSHLVCILIWNIRVQIYHGVWPGNHMSHVGVQQTSSLLHYSIKCKKNIKKKRTKTRKNTGKNINL